MAWFAVHFPCLGLEIFERRSPNADTVPAVLVEDGRVRLVNAAAHRAGIAPGSTLATAHGVATELKHFERDLPAEGGRLRALAEAAYALSPHVSLCEPDGLVLDMHGGAALFGDADTIAPNLERRFNKLGHAAQVAFAHTPAAALTLARAGKRGACPSHARPSLDALGDVSLTHTDIPARDVERLANMGVFHIGQLLSLPRDELGGRFGRTLQDYLARLTGEVADPRTPIVPRETFASTVHLLEAVSNKQTLLFPMRRLAAELAAWLTARQLGVLRLRWGFHPLRGAPCRVETRFARPRWDAKGILEIAKLRIENAELPEETMSIELAAVETAPRAGVADGLFATDPAAAPRDSKRNPPMELIDSIEARLGDAALKCLALADDHRPEHAWSLRRPGDASRGLPDVAASVAEIGGCRPLWLFDPPRPVSVARFRLLAGPERIEAGWWDDAMTRDYYVAVGENGAQCWLFRAHGGVRPGPDGGGTDDPSDGGWFLHGYFA